MKNLTTNEESQLLGRADDVARIVDNCIADRLTVVTSAPGCGLSSLLEAGLAPALMRAGMVTIVYRDWDGSGFVPRFKEAIATAVREQADPLFFVEKETLRQLLLRVKKKTGHDIAILLDQFEDYLLHHTGTDFSDAFDAELAHGLSVHNARFVIGLQDHATEELERLHQYVPNLLGNRTRIAALPVDAGRVAICNLALREGLEIESTVVDAMISAPAIQALTDSGSEGIHPFYAIQAIERLVSAERRVKSTMVRPSTLEQHGGTERLVLESLDGDLAELGKTQTDLFFRWCTLFISSEGRRVAVSEEKLTEFAGKLNRFAVPLLQRLADDGVLRQVEMPAGIRYEIAREPFTTILQDWWKRQEITAIARRRALFRKRSLSIAGGLIVAMYLIWLLMPSKG